MDGSFHSYFTSFRNVGDISESYRISQRTDDDWEGQQNQGPPWVTKTLAMPMDVGFPITADRF